MRLLKTHIHHSLNNLSELSQFTRLATRAICLSGNEILLLYTKRYDDLSLPGGGIDAGEDKITGLIRELQEETGAQNIKDIKPFGVYEEYRPWYKDDFDVIHMLSYCYTCSVDKALGETNYEAYEKKNGMEPKWLNIHEAISKNETTLAESEKKGMSVERETFLLKQIAKEFNL